MGGGVGGDSGAVAATGDLAGDSAEAGRAGDAGAADAGGGLFGVRAADVFAEKVGVGGDEFCRALRPGGATEPAGGSVDLALHRVWHWADLAEKFGWRASGGAERVHDAHHSSVGFVQRGISAFFWNDAGIDAVCAGAAGIFCFAAR